jgi:hypothetical protein
LRVDEIVFLRYFEEFIVQVKAGRKDYHTPSGFRDIRQYQALKKMNIRLRYSWKIRVRLMLKIY